MSCGFCAQPPLFVQTRGGWRGAGWRGESRGVHVDRKLIRRTCVIYSESDGNDLMVRNELSLGAPGTNNMIHFYSNAFYTNSFVGGEKCLRWHERGNSPRTHLSLLPLLCPGPPTRAQEMPSMRDGNEVSDFPHLRISIRMELPPKEDSDLFTNTVLCPEAHKVPKSLKYFICR